MGHCVTALKEQRADENSSRKASTIVQKFTISVSSEGDPSEQQNLGGILRPMITSFVDDIGVTGIAPRPSELFWAAMREYADKTEVNYDEGTHSWKCFRVGLSYSSFCFPNHPLDVQVFVGVYSWLGLLLDDETAKAPEAFAVFIERFATGLKQLTPLLEAWAELMRGAFKFWDPVVANFIVTSSLDFVTANVLETREEFQRLERTRGGKEWSWFVRNKDGVADAYAWFTFPKALYPDMSNFLEMVPDLSKYIAATNDILSFYKEERAGEEKNYIHNRSWYEKKTALTVLSEMMDEQREGVRRMRVVLEGREPYLQAVDEHINGYVAFHKSNDRYRLWEVGLGEVWRRAVDPPLDV